MQVAGRRSPAAPVTRLGQFLALAGAAGLLAVSLGR